MKILVTGSSGFIGTNLLDYLLQQGVEVLGIDRREPRSPTHLKHFAAGDLLDPNSLENLCYSFRPTAVIHLAARTDLGGKTLDDYESNVTGVRNLMSAIQKVGSVSRAIYTSSQLVCRVGYVPRHDQEFEPDTVYGESKVLTEKIVRESNGGCPVWCLVRPTTIWGPGMRDHYLRFLKMIERGHYFHVGHSPLYKSYGFVGNTVHQYLQLLRAPSESIHAKVFYLADYEPISLREWVNAFQCEMNVKKIRQYPRSFVHWAARVGDLINLMGFPSFPLNSFRLRNILTEYTFDLSGTKTVCGPLPFTMEDGVKMTMRWVRAGSP
ncbi:MAG: NAD-dependent epimerase/dehydratase family protein [Chthoniobacterales bacterium]